MGNVLTRPSCLVKLQKTARRLKLGHTLAIMQMIPRTGLSLSQRWTSHCSVVLLTDHLKHETKKNRPKHLTLRLERGSSLKTRLECLCREPVESLSAPELVSSCLEFLRQRTEKANVPIDETSMMLITSNFFDGSARIPRPSINLASKASSFI